MVGCWNSCDTSVQLLVCIWMVASGGSSPLTDHCSSCANNIIIHTHYYNILAPDNIVMMLYPYTTALLQGSTDRDRAISPDSIASSIDWEEIDKILEN